ncbi:MAG: 5-(carboxyamino)imidazole ribonucleotide synthase [Planctomycetia bacterium]
MIRTVGCLGAGQLGRMLALAGRPLDIALRFLDPGTHPPAAPVGELHVGRYDDPAALERFAAGLTHVTYEFENVPVAALERVGRSARIFPPARALAEGSDRLREKAHFQALGIPVAEHAPVDGLESLAAALARVGLPAVLKTRRSGYDGKGQAVVRTEEEARRALAALGGTPLLLERLVPFTREVSAIAVRSQQGEVRMYPLVENVHREGILRVSRAPAPGLAPGLEEAARGYVGRLMDDLGFVGVLTLEMFEEGGRLLANEMAPRVHNSGHWTLEGAETSQFENHLRAGLGLPLGATGARGHAGMVNLVGSVPPLEALLAIEGAHVHLYGKDARPARKLGHVTVVAASAAERDRRLSAVQALVEASQAPA